MAILSRIKRRLARWFPALAAWWTAVTKPEEIEVQGFHEVPCKHGRKFVK